MLFWPFLLKTKDMEKEMKAMSGISTCFCPRAWAGEGALADARGINKEEQSTCSENTFISVSSPHQPLGAIGPRPKFIEDNQ